jgi:superfamily II DNA or RNA helicase
VPIVTAYDSEAHRASEHSKPISSPPPVSELRVRAHGQGALAYDTRTAPNAVPVPCLHVFTDDVVTHRTSGLVSRFETTKMPLLALSFDYAGTIVPALGNDEDEEDDTSGVTRDVRAEMRARRLIEGFGALDLSCLEDMAAAPGVQADYLVACEGTASDYCTFQSAVVPQLRKLGFRVTVDAAHEWKTIEPEPRWYADIEEMEKKERDPNREDWFGVELGIELSGQRVSLLPALLDLLEKSANGDGLFDLARRAGKCVAVPVKEHVYLSLPTERLRSILRVLAELYDGKPIQKGALPVPSAKLGAMERLDEVFKNEEQLELRFTGGARDAWREAGAIGEPTPVEQPEGLRATLRPYQVYGLSWLQHLVDRGVGGVLADDMGLGKTLQTISHLALLKQRGLLTKPAIIVAPTSLVNNWAREAAKFAPRLRVLAIHGPDRAPLYEKLDSTDVVVTSYPVVIRDEEKLAETEFFILVLDEAQTIKNDKGRAHGAVRAIRTEHRLCLSGTPVENHLGELWALSDFLNPGLLGDELHFARFYRFPIEKQRNAERLETLREILSPYILRRTKAEVAKELPPKTELHRPIELRGDQRELYESIRVAAHAEVRKLIKKKGLSASTIPILGALTKLRQLCCDPRLVNVSGSIAKESAKLRVFDDLTTQLLKDGHRVLVFSQFTTMISILEESLRARKIAYTTLTGNTPDRPLAIGKFEKGEVDVFLISLRAGGTGLTLTGADQVIHYDPWWNPAVQAQATDRAYRIGQSRPVFVHHLYVAGSVEERMLRLQRKKRIVADAILGEGEGSAALTEDDVELLFAPLGAR